MRFVRENRQMANKKLYREDVLQVLFADSDSEGEYLPFGNDDRSSNDCASPLFKASTLLALVEVH